MKYFFTQVLFSLLIFHDKKLLTIASTILDEHGMAVKVFSLILIQLLQFYLNKLNENRNLILML